MGTKYAKDSTYSKKDFYELEQFEHSRGEIKCI